MKGPEDGYESRRRSEMSFQSIPSFASWMVWLYTHRASWYASERSRLSVGWSWETSVFVSDFTILRLTDYSIVRIYIKYRGEDTRGIDVRDGEPVDRPIGGHERGDLQVPHETVVLDWRVFTLAHRPHLTWSIRCDPLCDSAVMGAFRVPVPKTNGRRAPRVPSQAKEAPP